MIAACANFQRSGIMINEQEWDEDEVLTQEPGLPDCTSAVIILD